MCLQGAAARRCTQNREGLLEPGGATLSQVGAPELWGPPHTSTRGSQNLKYGQLRAFFLTTGYSCSSGSLEGICHARGGGPGSQGKQAWGRGLSWSVGGAPGLVCSQDLWKILSSAPQKLVHFHRW